MAPHTWSHLGDTVSDDKYRMYYRGQRIKEAYYRGEKIWGKAEDNFIVNIQIKGAGWRVKIIGEDLYYEKYNPQYNLILEREDIQSGVYKRFVSSSGYYSLYGKNITYIHFSSGDGFDSMYYTPDDWIKVLTPFDKACANITSFRQTFYGLGASNNTDCGLIEIPDELFKNTPNVTDFSECFMNCSGLRNIPANTFYESKNAINFSSCFKGCSVTSIPSDLFAHTPNVVDFSHCFERCRITSIPSDLFAHTPNVVDFSHCFKQCYITSIPSDLFAHTPNVVDFSHCFDSCALATSIPSDLFAHTPNVTNFESCFTYWRSLTSIPEGLFDNTPNVVDFSHCFEECGITSIPSDLFAHTPNVTKFEKCFAYCRSLTSIPEGLFDNAPLVGSFTNCFENCVNIVTIPNRLFAITIKNGVSVDNYAGLNYGYIFKNCTNLTEIPNELFGDSFTPWPINENEKYSPTFYGTFYNCTALRGTAPKLWTGYYIRQNGTIQHTVGRQCFYNCTGLSNYSEIPSNWKQNQ